MNALDRMTVLFQVITSSHVLLEVIFKMRADGGLFVFILDMKDMEFFNEIRPQIHDRKIITILPNDSEHSRSIGCSVLPRFQALLSDDLSIIAEVAARIIGTDCGQKPIERRGNNEKTKS